jgi:hypothetical protein
MAANLNERQVLGMPMGTLNGNNWGDSGRSNQLARVELRS